MTLSSFMRISLFIVGLVVIALIGRLFAGTQLLSGSSPFEVLVTTPTATLPTSTAGAATPTVVLPTLTSEAAITLCQTNDGASACQPLDLDLGQNLADPGNSVARPAVSKDALPDHLAKYGNDGSGDTSWVSNSANSWIKLDLGQFRTFNMVTLAKGNSAQDNNLGQFVIAVALSDVYVEGNSIDDEQEYTLIFDSKQAGFSDASSHVETITTRFSLVEARFVKITFEKAGAVVEELGVFRVEESTGLTEQLTRIPQGSLPGIRLTPTHRDITATPILMSTPTNPPAHTRTATAGPSQPPTNAPQPSNTPVPLPTSTKPPVNTSTPVPPTAILPTLPPPTDIIPTDILPTSELTSSGS